MIMQMAMMDILQKPFADIMDEHVLGPLGMADSTFAQPLPPSFDAEAARAHDWRGNALDAKWHVYPEQAAAGLWTTPTDLAQVVVEVQKAVGGFASRVLNQTMARQMITPVGVGPYAVGFAIEQHGEGWYFSHTGGNWGFQCRLVAHFLKGYGLVVMTNGDNAWPVISEIEARVASAYGWDSLHKPIPQK
jgi:CubicO group peptidase (beta-lactamase class C family)